MTQTSPAPTTAVPPYRIVIGMDFDDTGEEALREALRLSIHRDNVELHVVHVITPRGATVRRADGIMDLSANLEKGPEVLREHLLAISPRMPPTGARSIRLHVRVGEPSAVIHQLAVDVNADLIVVGTHGRKGLARLALGSVAGHLVQVAHCPVLVARPKQFEGLAVTESPAPPCAECAKVRAATQGAKPYCPLHEQPSLHFQPYTSSQVFAFGQHPPGSIV